MINDQQVKKLRSRRTFGDSHKVKLGRNDRKQMLDWAMASGLWVSPSSTESRYRRRLTGSQGVSCCPHNPREGKQCPDHSNSIFRRSEDHLLTHWGQRF